MYCNSGRFINNATIGGCLYITDHKHKAVYGDKDNIKYGESEINSCIYGKDIGITASNKLFTDSIYGTNLGSKQYVHIESGSNSINHSSGSGFGIEIVSKNGDTLVNSEGYSTTIKSTNYVNLNSGSGITVNNISYGTSLPSSGVEGQIFFKLIS